MIDGTKTNNKAIKEDNKNASVKTNEVLKVCYNKKCDYKIMYDKAKRICCPSCNQVLLESSEWELLELKRLKQINQNR